MMMKRLASMLRRPRGTAAAEMALVTPLLLALMLGSVELGNFFMDQHALTKQVRDGARYASRLAINQCLCLPWRPYSQTRMRPRKSSTSPRWRRHGYRDRPRWPATYLGPHMRRRRTDAERQCALRGQGRSRHRRYGLHGNLHQPGRDRFRSSPFRVRSNTVGARGTGVQRRGHLHAGLRSEAAVQGL